ncbi:MAG: hypothetical protein HOP08_04760 [Cyclobacteriaceae bacterium]|nr:hypothetical protein [Cyclobacteriaceae bacterium]
MNLTELATAENELYAIVLQAHGTMEDKAIQLRSKGVYDKYKQIHKWYADQSENELESLKRGLFIQWYALSEPPCFTGINELALEAERKIINQVNKLIASDSMDYELRWMLKHYSTWDYVFERFMDFKELQEWIANKKGDELPDTIDRSEMAKRGQTGRYWNSLINSSNKH